MVEKFKNTLRLEGKTATYWAYLSPILKKVCYFMFPLYALLILVYMGIFSTEVNEMIVQIGALLVLLLGLPLSAGLRVDQLSLELGASFPREIVLVIASLITWINLTIIIAFRSWMKSKN